MRALIYLIFILVSGFLITFNNAWADCDGSTSDCKQVWNIYSSIQGGDAWASKDPNLVEQLTKIENQSQKIITLLEQCGIKSILQNSTDFRGLKGDLLIVISGPFLTSTEASAELKIAEKCKIKGYSKSATRISSETNIVSNKKMSKVEKETKYGFEGKWNCQVAIFEFTKNKYYNGSEWLDYQKVERDTNGYIINLGNDYRIGLSDIKNNSLNWSSSTSEDSFSCERIANDKNIVNSENLQSNTLNKNTLTTNQTLNNFDIHNFCYFAFEEYKPTELTNLFNKRVIDGSIKCNPQNSAFRSLPFFYMRDNYGKVAGPVYPFVQFVNGKTYTYLVTGSEDNSFPMEISSLGFLSDEKIVEENGFLKYYYTENQPSGCKLSYVIYLKKDSELGFMIVKGHFYENYNSICLERNSLGQRLSLDQRELLKIIYSGVKPGQSHEVGANKNYIVPQLDPSFSP